MLEFATTFDLRNVKEVGAGRTLFATAGQSICASTPRNTASLAVCQVFRLSYSIGEDKKKWQVGHSLQEAIKLITKSGFWADTRCILQTALKPNGFLNPSDGIPVLAIAAISTETNFRFTRAGWDRFMDSLQPHSYDEKKYEVQFHTPNIKLNVYNLFYENSSYQTMVIDNPERLIHNYYKSGTVLTFSTSATMYGGGLQSDEGNGHPGPISQMGGGYQVQLNHSGRVYELYIST
ncbi:hypothetical protein V496_00955 [Pseudogymnoascus sp. VKM F-4515 (FW-2607)]|nr:hypothetical protein V496_00955 [Pseudogymnoascus sp. VKM F-4515 (FW-2607)]